MKINQLLEDHYSSLKPGARIDQEKKDRELGIGHDWVLKPGDTQPTYVGRLEDHPDLQLQTDFITDIPANKGDEPNRYIEKLKKAGKWYLDSLDDAGQSIGRGLKDVFVKGPSIKRELQGVGEFGKRRWDALQDVMKDDVNRMRKLAGLNEAPIGWGRSKEIDDMEFPTKGVRSHHKDTGWDDEKDTDSSEDVWAYSPQGASDIVARIVKTDHGFQVYVRGPYGWIAQGQPHKSQEEAEADAKLFFEAVETLDVDQLNEEQFLEAMSLLELHDEELTEEQLNEVLPAVAAGVGAGLGMWGIDQMSKPHEERTWTKLWRKFGPKKKEMGRPGARYHRITPISRPKEVVAKDRWAIKPLSRKKEKEVVAKDRWAIKPLSRKKKNEQVTNKESEELNEFLPAVAGAAALAGAGYAGYKWLKGLKKKVKDRKDTHQDKIDQALKDSIDPNPWWNDMDSTLQEMKAEMMVNPKKNN